MNILDFHTHAYPDKIADRLTARMQAATPGAKRYGDGTVTMLQQRNAARGITHCVQLNIAATGNSVTRMNDFAISVRDRQGIIPFGTLHPDQSLQQMHDELFRLLSPRLQGNTQFLSKMKPYWEYLMPDRLKRDKKAILKATTIEKYKAAVATALAGY